jgi:RNA polymerase sigma-70 factor, ECF subfamily
VRRVQMDHARGLCRDRGGGAAGHLRFDEAVVLSARSSAALVACDGALHALARLDPRMAQVVELRYFGGLTVDEAVEGLHVDPNTIVCDWRLGKRWLKRELGHGAEGGHAV